MEYKDMQYPTRQDMRNEIARLNKELIDTKKLLLVVTAVCNGSSAMEHLDAFRSADSLLQEENNHRMKFSLEKIYEIKKLYPAIDNSMRLKACISEAFVALKEFI